jgi:hypothetical protein
VAHGHDPGRGAEDIEESDWLHIAHGMRRMVLERVRAGALEDDGDGEETG